MPSDDGAPPAPRVPTFLLDPAHEELLAGGSGSRLPASTLAAPGAGCGCVFLAVFVAAGLLLLSFAAREWRVWWILRERGVDAIATVVELREHHDEGSSYHVRFRLEVPPGPPVEVDEQLERDRWRALAVGETVPVRHAPDDPAIARTLPLGASTRTMATVFASVWNLFVWPIWLMCLREVWRAHRLSRQGRLLPGRVVKATSRLDSDNDFFVKVEYAFEDPAGRELRGETEAVRKDLFAQPLPEPGTPVRVLWVDDRLHRIL